MAAKTLLFACAVIGVVAGNTFQFQSGQEFNFPVDTIYASPATSSSSVSAPVVVDSLFTSPSTSASAISTPVIAAPVVSTPVVATPVVAVQPTDGPESSPLPVIQAPAVTLPAVEGKLITLSSDPIPATRVLSQRCICTKTIVKPQIIQRHVTAPKLQRYVKRTFTPVVENVSYKSTPITQGATSGPAIVIPGSAPQTSSTTTVVATAPVATTQVATAPVVAATPVVATPVVAAAPVATAQVSTAQVVSATPVVATQSESSYNRYY